MARRREKWPGKLDPTSPSFNGNPRRVSASASELSVGVTFKALVGHGKVLTLVEVVGGPCDENVTTNPEGIAVAFALQGDMLVS